MGLVVCAGAGAMAVSNYLLSSIGLRGFLRLSGNAKRGSCRGSGSGGGLDAAAAVIIDLFVVFLFACLRGFCDLCFFSDVQACRPIEPIPSSFSGSPAVMPTTDAVTRGDPSPSSPSYPSPPDVVDVPAKNISSSEIYALPGVSGNGATELSSSK